MVKRECILNTCHDELFYHLIIPKVENQNDKTSIKLVGTEKLFSAQEIFMLMIILDHYKKTDALGVPLTFKFIQTSYRNRRLGKEHSIPKPDYRNFAKAINGLKNKWISLEIKNTRRRYHINNSKYSSRRLININFTKGVRGNVIFDYGLGEYGNVLMVSKRFSDILPIDIIRLPYKQVSALYIGLYLSRLIFINRRKKKTQFNVTIKSIMKNIMLHTVNGDNTGITLLSKLEQSIPNKYSYICNFRNHLEMVLKMLIENKSIASYEVLPLDIEDMNISNYEKLKLQINIK